MDVVTEAVVASCVGLIIPTAGNVPTEDEDGGSAADIDSDDVRTPVLGSCLECVRTVFDGLYVEI